MWWVAAGGAALFVVVMAIDGAVRPGYSPRRHTVSALATGPRGWVQTANFLLGGIAITGGAVGLMVTGASVSLGAILTVFGVGVVASGVFPMDPMRGYPPGTSERDPRSFSRSHERHDHAGAVVFFSLPVAAVVGAFALPGPLWTVTSTAVAVILVAALVAFNSAWEHDRPSTGLVQRLFIVPGWLWVAALYASQALG